MASTTSKARKGTSAAELTSAKAKYVFAVRSQETGDICATVDNRNRAFAKGKAASDWYVYNLATGTKAAQPNRATAAVAMAHPLEWDSKAKGTPKSQHGKGAGKGTKPQPKGSRKRGGTKATTAKKSTARRGVTTRQASPKERKAMAAARKAAKANAR